MKLCIALPAKPKYGDVGLYALFDKQEVKMHHKVVMRNAVFVNLEKHYVKRIVKNGLSSKKHCVKKCVK